MPRSLTRTTAIGLDFACILASLAVAAMWSGHDGARPGAGLIAALGSGFVVVWMAIGSRNGVYRVPPGRNLALSLRRMAESWGATWGIAGLLTISFLPVSTASIWIALAAGLVLLAAPRLLLAVAPVPLSFGAPRAIIVGSCDSARALSGGMDVDVVGVVPFTGEDPAEMAHLRTLGDIDDLPRVLRQNEIDIALVSPSDAARTGEVHRVFRTCDDLGLGVQYFPSFLDVDHLRVDLAWNDQRAGLAVRAMLTPSFAQFSKRAVDVAGAAAGIVALAPVFVICALAVKLTSRGPVFFRQPRVGQSERLFDCLKFRTMRVGAHAQQELLRANSTQDGPAFKIPQDPRVTPVGRFLRKFSLDELPQLFNVLVGDMSLVGPRPPIPTEVDKYTWWQRRRVSVKPGLTCVWQVYGRNRVSFKRWVEMDLYYIDNWSLWLDLKLIAHTFRAVMRGTGM